MMRGNPNFLTADEWRTLCGVLRLSERECQITSHLIDGCSEAEIARHLGISHHTVHTYVERLHRKLNVANGAQLVGRLFETYATLVQCNRPIALANPISSVVASLADA
jgi:DNA-binding NarL/FixJ family response regulator